jgi:asparagine synthase (glutamine-hydrolysing)
LPQAIWDRPKQGFAFPFQQWMAATNLPVPNNALSNQFKADLQSGKTHWSRYWCYCLAQMPTKEHAAW